MTENALSPEAFQLLMQLQELDAAIDQLVHRREHSPAHTALREVQHDAAQLRPQLAEATSKRDAVLGHQSKIESEVEGIERRIVEINARLYGSVAVSPKDAQAMSTEVSSLEKHKSELEDQELDFMEQLEPLQKTVGELEAQARNLASRAASAHNDVAAEQHEIDTVLEEDRKRRESLASGVPSVLLSDYERLRHSLGGVGAAYLIGNACSGCHLTLAASEVDRVRRATADEVVHCEECGRILVRKDQ